MPYVLDGRKTGTSQQVIASSENDALGMARFNDSSQAD